MVDLLLICGSVGYCQRYGYPLKHIKGVSIADGSRCGGPCWLQFGTAGILNPVECNTDSLT